MENGGLKTCFLAFASAPKLATSSRNRVFFQHFLRSVQGAEREAKAFQKHSKNDQQSLKIQAFGERVLALLLGGGPKSSFFASWLSKNCLGSFFFASWSIFGNFWGPNMASTSALKWLENRSYLKIGLGWPPGGLREPFWSDVVSILGVPGASRA